MKRKIASMLAISIIATNNMATLNVFASDYIKDKVVAVEKQIAKAMVTTPVSGNVVPTSTNAESTTTPQPEVSRSNVINEEESSNEFVITMPQKGHEAKERDRAKISFALYANEPTGVYLCPGESLEVIVEADPNGILPEVVVGWDDFRPLKVGSNTITLSESQKEPQRIYLANRALPEDQEFAPTIRVKGGRKYPVYNHGKTDPKAFMEELREYTKTVEPDFSKFSEGFKGKNPNFTDLNSENIFIGVSALGAYAGLQNQLETRNKDADYTMDIYEDMYREYVKYSGFDYELVESRPWNMRPRGKFMLVGSHAGPFGWAQHGFTAYNGGGVNRDSGFWSSLVQASTIENGGWAVFHEIGHSFDNSKMVTHESTNNLYSLMMQDKYIENNRMVQENRWEKHFTSYHNTKKYPNDQLFLGAITYQLEGVFGRDLYGKAQKIVRENKENWTNGLNNKETHAVAISKALNINVLPHYEYYGIAMGDKAQKLVKDLPVLDKAVKYVNDKVFRKDAIAFTNKQVKPVVKASGSKEVTLNISIDQPDNALLVYEIYRDGTYLGVTYGNTFVDKTSDPNKEHTYTVKAFDRKLNESQISAPVKI